MVTLDAFISSLPLKLHAQIVREWEEVLDDHTAPTPAIDKVVVAFRKRNDFAESHTRTLEERVVFQCYRAIAVSHLGPTSH